MAKYNSFSDLGETIITEENNSIKMDKEQSNSFSNNQQLNDIPEERKAKTPYNFVPLNNDIVESDFNIENCPFNKYHTDRKTGFIEISIKPKTPLYIRDLEELTNYKKNKGERKKFEDINSDFFSPLNGKLRIPGSSLRGMIKTLVEIIGFGKFINFDNKRLYFRGFADKSLKKDYSSFGLSKFDKKNNVTKYAVKAGFLRKVGLNYTLIEAGSPIRLKKNISQNLISTYDKFPFQIENENKEFNKDETNNMDFNFFWNKERTECIVISGSILDKNDNPIKNVDWKIEKKENPNEITILPEDVKEYLNDENRTKNVNLIKAIENVKNKEIVPCFYAKWKDETNNHRIIFGHTPLFRVPYRKSIGDHVFDNLKSDKLDIAEAIFGNENLFSGRVFFEDAFCETDKIDLLEIDEKIPKVLGNPNPTSFQLYLTQDSCDREKLRNYNVGYDKKLAPIRGNKLYWHKKDSSWEEKNLKVLEEIKVGKNKVHTKIRPLINLETEFTGKIRFENLSEVELGALLFAIDLPKECCHKIGMAKPLGFGSIRIESELSVSNREERYKNLEFEWETTEKINKAGIDNYKKAYEKFIMKGLKKPDSELWKESRMQELRAMLTFEHRINNNEIDYMILENNNSAKDGFRERKVLPKATAVKKN